MIANSQLLRRNRQFSAMIRHEANPLGRICMVRRLAARGTYTLVWDSSTLPDDAAQQKQVETYRLLFEKMLYNMNKLSEDRTLTPEDMQAPVNF